MKFDIRYRLPRFTEEHPKRNLSGWVIDPTGYKTSVRQRADFDNEQIDRDISAVTRMVEKKASHLSKSGTFVSYFDGCEVLQIKQTPAQVTSVHVLLIDGTYSEVEFIVKQDRYLQVYPQVLSQYGYKVEFTGGYENRDDLPEEFITAVRSQMDFIYFRRDAQGLPTAPYSKGWDSRALVAIEALQTWNR